jgi:thioredoxin-related protein
VFGAVSQQFRDIDFRKINIDDPANSDLVQRHQARSIPRIVFTDGGGKELVNHNPSMSPDALIREINQYR